MVYQQSAFDKWPIDDVSCQLIATSPPYYALRKYNIPDVIIGGDKNCPHEFEIKKHRKEHHGKIAATLKTDAIIEYQQGFCIHCSAWKGQYGLENTPFGDEHSYVSHTLLWAKEAWRVLRNDGIFFLNIADSYPSGGGKAIEQSFKRKSAINSGAYPDNSPSANLRKTMPRCKLLIPHRIAIALIDEGWILRNDIPWYKPNAMPESVTDRFSKKYEFIFMFTKQEKYYFDLNSVREPHKEVSLERVKHQWNGHREAMSSYSNMDISKMCHSLGKNPGDIWNIPTSPSKERHYAMWPERLVERMIKCSTKPNDIVLDCFAGSCTTGIVAEGLHRKFIGIELGYADIHKRRMSRIQKKLLL